MNKFRVYCGPTCVHTLAELLRHAQHVTVTLEGTEHVYLETSLTINELFKLVQDLPFGLNHSDLQYLGAN